MLQEDWGRIGLREREEAILKGIWKIMRKEKCYFFLCIIVPWEITYQHCFLWLLLKTKIKVYILLSADALHLRLVSSSGKEKVNTAVFHPDEKLGATACSRDQPSFCSEVSSGSCPRQSLTRVDCTGKQEKDAYSIEGYPHYPLSPSGWPMKVFKNLT